VDLPDSERRSRNSRAHLRWSSLSQRRRGRRVRQRTPKTPLGTAASTRASREKNGQGESSPTSGVRATKGGTSSPNGFAQRLIRRIRPTRKASARHESPIARQVASLRATRVNAADSPRARVRNLAASRRPERRRALTTPTRHGHRFTAAMYRAASSGWRDHGTPRRCSSVGCCRRPAASARR
jgi:hypothetical protein